MMRLPKDFQKSIILLVLVLSLVMLNVGTRKQSVLQKMGELVIQRSLDVPTSDKVIQDLSDVQTLENKMYPDFKNCSTKPLNPYYHQRADIWVLENYIPADLSFRCNESITYTTHGDYTHLENLVEVASRWQGPVSVSVYSPGGDFSETVNTILFLRQCSKQVIKKFVTFHLILNNTHMPQVELIPPTKELLERKIDCKKGNPKWFNVTTYKKQKNLLYPVNVARNVARVAAQTYFVAPADIELYPSTNFIPEFFKMLKRPDKSNTTNPRVYVFPVFEVLETVEAPKTKDVLQELLKRKEAISFHRYVCGLCHNIPMSKEWQEAPVQADLRVFNIGKRVAVHRYWEPFYLGTNKDPLFDERLSWEGKSDKMQQAFTMCLLDYEFHILDPAFLVHKPGIKRGNPPDKFREHLAFRQIVYMKKKILPELYTLYGNREGCKL